MSAFGSATSWIIRACDRVGDLEVNDSPTSSRLASDLECSPLDVSLELTIRTAQLYSGNWRTEVRAFSQDKPASRNIMAS